MDFAEYLRLRIAALKRQREALSGNGSVQDWAYAGSIAEAEHLLAAYLESNG